MLTLAIPLTAGFLAGGRNPYAQCILFGLMAAALALSGETCRLPTRLGYVFTALLLLGLVSLLPRTWFALPEWRAVMEHDFGVPKMPTLSPQPWILLEEWFLLATCAVWLSLCAGAVFQEKHRRFLLQGLTCGIAGMALLALTLKWFSGDSFIARIYAQWRGNKEIFSLFPNRNHFASLCASGVLLAAVCCRDAWLRKRWFGSLYWAICVAPLFAAVMATQSRGGLLILSLGLIAWVSALVMRRFTLRRVGLAAVVILTLTTAVMIAGRSVFERFTRSMNEISLFNSDARFHVFRDTARMLSKHPVFGIGLGNFDNVFPRYQTYSNHVARFIHPESDWLWLGSEMGVPALLLALAAVSIFVIAALRGGKKNESGTDRHLRVGALVASCMTLIHGLVDTPMHLMAPGLTAFLLLGISIRRDSQPTNAGISRHLRHVACTGLILLSANSWATGTGRPWWPSGSATLISRSRSWSLISDNQPGKALPIIQEVIQWEPMGWEGYFLRAAAKIKLRQPPAGILQDFATARYLEPNSGPLCWNEAELWLQLDPSYAISAWREAMRRETAEATNYYYTILRRLPEYPNLRQAIRSLGNTPSLKVLYLCIAGNESDGRSVIDDVLREDPELVSLSGYDQYRFFLMWSRLGDRDKVLEALSSNPNWRKSGWVVLSDHLASKNNFKAAYDLALEYVIPPHRREEAISDDVDKLRRDHLFNPGDIKISFDLFEAQRKAGLKRDAITTLEQLVKNPEAKRSLYELALLHAEMGDFKTAWTEIRSYSGY